MKKRILAAVLATMLTVSFVACGDKKEAAKEPAKEEVKQEETKKEDKPVKIDVSEKTLGYDVFEYVELGDYKGIEITLAGDYEFTDEGYANYIDGLFNPEDLYVEDANAKTVAEDSIINVDYVGKLDGTAFEGGSANDVLIDIANNGSVSGSSYIPGFTEGLVGHEVGESVDCDVTFPKDYGNTQLAGKAVVFTFKINYIAKNVSASDLSKKEKAQKLGYKDADEMETATKKAYQAKLDSNLEKDKRTIVLNTICNNATVKGVPEQILQGRIDLYINGMKQEANNYGMKLEDMISTYYGIEYEEFEQQIKENIQEALEQEMILEAIARQEKIEVTSEDFQKYVDDIVAKNSTTFPDAQSLYDAYTTDAIKGETYAQLQYLVEQALKLCIDNAKVAE